MGVVIGVMGSKVVTLKPAGVTAGIEGVRGIIAGIGVKITEGGITGIRGGINTVGGTVITGKLVMIGGTDSKGVVMKGEVFKPPGPPVFAGMVTIDANRQGGLGKGVGKKKGVGSKNGKKFGLNCGPIATL